MDKRDLRSSIKPAINCQTSKDGRKSSCVLFYPDYPWSSIQDMEDRTLLGNSNTGSNISDKENKNGKDDDRDDDKNDGPITLKINAMNLRYRKGSAKESAEENKRKVGGESSPILRNIKVQANHDVDSNSQQNVRISQPSRRSTRLNPGIPPSDLAHVNSPAGEAPKPSKKIPKKKIPVKPKTRILAQKLVSWRKSLGRVKEAIRPTRRLLGSLRSKGFKVFGHAQPGKDTRAGNLSRKILESPGAAGKTKFSGQENSSATRPAKSSAPVPVMSSSVESVISSAAKYVVSSALESVISSALESVISSAPVPVISSSVESVISSSVESVLSSALESVISPAPVPVISSSVESVISSSVESVISSAPLPANSSASEPLISSFPGSVDSAGPQPTTNRPPSECSLTLELSFNDEEEEEVVNKKRKLSESPERGTKRYCTSSSPWRIQTKQTCGDLCNSVDVPAKQFLSPDLIPGSSICDLGDDQNVPAESGLDSCNSGEDNDDKDLDMTCDHLEKKCDYPSNAQDETAEYNCYKAVDQDNVPSVDDDQAIADVEPVKVSSLLAESPRRSDGLSGDVPKTVVDTAKPLDLVATDTENVENYADPDKNDDAAAKVIAIQTQDHWVKSNSEIHEGSMETNIQTQKLQSGNHAPAQDVSFESNVHKTQHNIQVQETPSVTNVSALELSVETNIPTGQDEQAPMDTYVATEEVNIDANIQEQRCSEEENVNGQEVSMDTKFQSQELLVEANMQTQNNLQRDNANTQEFTKETNVATQELTTADNIQAQDFTEVQTENIRTEKNMKMQEFLLESDFQTNHISQETIAQIKGNSQEINVQTEGSLQGTIGHTKDINEVQEITKETNIQTQELSVETNFEPQNTLMEDNVQIQEHPKDTKMPFEKDPKEIDFPTNELQLDTNIHAKEPIIEKNVQPQDIPKDKNDQSQELFLETHVQLNKLVDVNVEPHVFPKEDNAHMQELLCETNVETDKLGIESTLQPSNISTLNIMMESNVPEFTISKDENVQSKEFLSEANVQTDQMAETNFHAQNKYKKENVEVQALPKAKCDVPVYVLPEPALPALKSMETEGITNHSGNFSPSFWTGNLQELAKELSVDNSYCECSYLSGPLNIDDLDGPMVASDLAADWVETVSNNNIGVQDKDYIPENVDAVGQFQANSPGFNDGEIETKSGQLGVVEFVDEMNNINPSSTLGSKDEKPASSDTNNTNDIYQGHDGSIGRDGSVSGSCEFYPVCRSTPGPNVSSVLEASTNKNTSYAQTPIMSMPQQGEFSLQTCRVRTDCTVRLHNLQLPNDSIVFLKKDAEFADLQAEDNRSPVPTESDVDQRDIETEAEIEFQKLLKEIEAINKKSRKRSA